MPSAVILRCHLPTCRAPARWFPERIEGSLALATRSILVFPDQRVSWDVTVLQSDRRFEFH